LHTLIPASTSAPSVAPPSTRCVLARVRSDPAVALCV
jgi:hypothetical protein